jgi:hypothetical protein
LSWGSRGVELGFRRQDRLKRLTRGERARLSPRWVRLPPPQTGAEALPMGRKRSDMAKHAQPCIDR